MSSAAPPEVAEALDAWAAFPVDANPRPLVLWHQVVAPQGGFHDEDSKNAYESGQFELATELPDEPAPIDGLPLIGGQGIMSRLRASGSDGPFGSAPLRVTDVDLDEGTFVTDRGHRVLPAWKVTFDGVAHPARVLAVAPEALFEQPGRVHHTRTPLAGASLVDPVTLEVAFIGSPRTMPVTYAATVHSSKTAVAVVVDSEWTGDRNMAVRAVGQGRTVRVTLTDPLGARVLIDGRARYALPVVDPDTSLRDLLMR